MRIDCQHGYFKFTETYAGELSRFMNLFDLEVERNGDHFTFSDLVGAPDYSIPGGDFLGCPTTEAFEGSPAEVMRANSLVYDFTKGLIVPIATVVQLVSIDRAENYFYSSGMIVPGSVTVDGLRVKDYSAHFSFDRNSFRYTEVAGE